MKAIILAAGKGTRLGSLTKNKPKCLVKYKGITILDHIINTLKECNINDITLIRGYKGNKITRTDIHYVTNTKYETTNMVYTLFCAEEVMEDDVIVSYGDIIYMASVLEKLIKSPYEISVVVDKKWRELWDKRMDDPLLDAETMKINSNDQIIELGKKPNSYDDIEGQYIGLIKISSTVIEQVKFFYHSLDQDKHYDGKDFNNMYMTTFIQSIINELIEVYAVYINGGWVEIDEPSDLSIDCV